MTPMLRGRLLHDRLRTDDPQQVAALQRDAGRDRDVLTAAADRAQIKAARPILGREIGQGLGLPAFGFMTRDVRDGDGDVEELLVLDLLGARSDQVDHDLARAGEGDHVARLERVPGSASTMRSSAGEACG